ncbi:hypothetical protein N1851_012136 [Merluccius polli]|uniref:Uncharacterized protein n=1 Tax=Merluccius polli TaxID=89951 RepID=A0AA47MWY4_MERPO|nr:hypothetical protein N1851_012136 [Merluccius polli]
MESNRNASRKRRRRAARQAKLKELFPQRDNQPERENESEASLPEPPSDCAREGENLAESTLDSETCSSADNQRQRYISIAQSGGSSQAEKSESVDPVDPVQPLGAERREVTATRARQPHLVDKVEQKQHFATCITGENRQKPLGSVRQSDRGSDNVCFVNSTGEESHGALSLAESTDAPVTAPSSFTFGTVVASLYPLACRQVKSENRNLADQLNPTRERSMTGDSLENSASISADLPGNDEDTSRISGGPFGSHDRKSMNTHLSDVLKEDGKSCVSVAADTTTNHAEVDCQESVHECTGRPNNPQPTTNEDMTTSDVNNELLNACATREGSHLQGGALESPHDLGLQCKKPSEQQIMADEDAGKAQTEAEDDIQMQLNLTQTLAPTQVVQETTDPASQPHLSPFMSACENQEVHQHNCCDVATGFICVDKSEDGIQPTVSVSTTNIYPEQGREIEQLEEICAITFKAADISVGDKSIPELEDEHGCSAVDVSQETLQTSLEVAAEPDNRGNESTNNLEDGDITPTIEYEDSVSECIKVNRYSSTHPYMLGEEIELALVEKPVCTPADAERSTIEDAASKQDYFGSYAVRTEDKNWEMMVEEEEEDGLGEEVMTKEVAENGGKGKDELKEEQTIAEQQALEKTVGCEKREHTETEFEGQKHVCVTEEKSKEEPFIWEEQEVDEEEVKKDADHGTDNQHDVWEDIRIEEKENLAETDRETRVPVEDKAERISVDEEESSVSGAGEGGLVVVEEEIVVGTAKAERNEEMERPETRSHASQNKAESDPATPVSNVHEGEVERVIDKENSLENGTTCFPNEMHLISKEEGQSISYRLHLTNDRSKALSESPRWGSDSSAAENGSLIFTDELKCDPMAEEQEEEEEEEEEDSSSSGSPSDEEMELYIHRMRAAPSPQTLRSFPRDGGSGKGSHTGKRPSIDRPRLLSSSMPAISESVNEEHLSDLDCPEEREVETFQAGSTPFPAQDNQEYEGVNTAQWTDAFSCSNIIKSLLYITMFVVFVVVAYHYDFLACFALYLLSIFWLYCRADKQPVPNNNGLN